MDYLVGLVLVTGASLGLFKSVSSIFRLIFPKNKWDDYWARRGQTSTSREIIALWFFDNENWERAKEVSNFCIHKPTRLYVWISSIGVKQTTVKLRDVDIELCWADKYMLYHTMKPTKTPEQNNQELLHDTLSEYMKCHNRQSQSS